MNNVKPQLVEAILNVINNNQVDKYDTTLFGYHVVNRTDHLYAAFEIENIEVDIIINENKIESVSIAGEYTFNDIDWVNDKPVWKENNYDVSYGEYSENIVWSLSDKTESYYPFDEHDDSQLIKDVMSEVFEKLTQDQKDELAKWVWNDSQKHIAGLVQAVKPIKYN